MSTNFIGLLSFHVKIFEKIVKNTLLLNKSVICFVSPNQKLHKTKYDIELTGNSIFTVLCDNDSHCLPSKSQSEKFIRNYFTLVFLILFHPTNYQGFFKLMHILYMIIKQNVCLKVSAWLVGYFFVVCWMIVEQKDKSIVGSQKSITLDCEESSPPYQFYCLKSSIVPWKMTHVIQDCKECFAAIQFVGHS